MPVPYGSRFVGREAELGILCAELTAALRGEGQLVILAGEPGIGKTRTAAALAAQARELGASVAWGRCHEGEGAPVYWPWVQALGLYAAEHHDAPASEVAALLPILRAGTALPVTDGVPERARFELCDRVATALTAAARAQPLLVVLDDLHWADAGSLVLLEFLARQLESIPLLVLGTLRDVELQQRPDVAPLLSAVVRLGRSVPLAGLARSAVQELLSDRLGRAPEGLLVDEVLGLTEGNPFFVIEVAHLLERTPAAGASAGLGTPAVPPGAQELLRQRLAPLPARSLRLLEAAAVMGREFELQLLAIVLEESPEAILEALSPALALSLVREVPGALRSYAFTHALMREALYLGLAPGVRARLHRAVGEAMEAVGSPDDVLLPALAHHFFAAAQGTDPTKAIRYGCEAGERALRLLAFEEGVRHFERALAAIALAGDEAARLRAMVGSADALHGTGEPARAEAVFRDAVVVAQRLGPSAFAETVLRFADARAESGMLDVEMNTLLEQAMTALPPEPTSVRARLMARLAAGLHLQPGAELRRKRLADEAAAMARALAEPATLGYVLTRRLVGLLGPDHLDERLATTDELLSAKSKSRAAELEALIFRVDDLAERGDRVGLDHALAVFEQTVRSFRHPYFVWTAASFRAAMALLEGRFGEAEVVAAEALSLGQQAQTRTALLRFAQQFFMLRGWQARLAEVEPFIETGVAETAVVPAWRCGLADFYSVSGREAEARREFEALAASDFSMLPRDTNWLTAMVLLAGVCARLGDVRRAALLYDLMRPYAGRIAVARPLVVMVGLVDQRLGALAGMQGRYEVAEQHFAGASALAERMRGLPWQADIRHQWAKMLCRRGGRGDRERADTLLGEADAIARPLGMALLLGWIAATRDVLRSGETAIRAGLAEPGANSSGNARGAAAPVPGMATAGSAPGPRGGTFHCDGGIWTLVFEGRTTRVRDMLGMGHLARLLGQPERDVHVTDLVASAYGRRRDAPAAQQAFGDAGEMLDARARAGYEARLRDAHEELGEARQLNDRGRVERLADEIELLTAELSRAYGLGGRTRRAGSANERARVAVTRAIKYAIDRIAEHDLALAEHLRIAVRTGTFCVYAPPARDRVSWTL